MALCALLACSVVSVPFTGDLIAPGGAQAFEGGDTPVDVPATDEEPVPCGIDAAADPCPEGTPDPFPVAVVDPLEVDTLPATGYRGREGTDWEGIGILLAAFCLIGAIAITGAKYGAGRAKEGQGNGRLG